MRGKDSMRTVVVVLCMLLHVHIVVTSSSDDHELTISSSAVLQDGKEAPMVYRRASSRKRMIRAAYSDQSVEGYSEEEQRIIVEKHNEFRRLEKSSDMMFMYWDDNLASLAQSWANKCAFKHSPGSMRMDFGSHSHLGENLYASTGTYDPSQVIQAWYDEVKFYTYSTMRCTGVCGHYTQVVWAQSYAVGCGVRYCPELANVRFGRGFLVSCNYGPSGNYVGEHPYKKGDACSACDPDAPYCVQGLCAKYPVVGGSEASSATSRVAPFIVLIGSCTMSAILSWLHS